MKNPKNELVAHVSKGKLFFSASTLEAVEFLSKAFPSAPWPQDENGTRYCETGIRVNPLCIASSPRAPAESVLKQVMGDNWQPISTAPDGELVETCVSNPPHPPRAKEFLRRRGELWFTADDGCYVYYKPTHWRRLTDSRISK